MVWGERTVENMVKRAYFYYLSTEYRLSELLVSIQSLKDTGTPYDIGCILDPEITNEAEEALKAEGIKVFRNTDPSIGMSMKSQYNKWGNQFTFGCIGKL